MLYYSALSNWFRKRTSFSKYRRRSPTPYLSIAIRSIPIPNANPENSFGSILLYFKTFGSTIPQPIISNHPVPLHTPQPLPPHIEHETSTSADGSVNGKYDGRIRICACSPKSSLANYSSDCFMSANDTLRSIYKPSIWWKMQCAR